jgi:hypothetical protein
MAKMTCPEGRQLWWTISVVSIADEKLGQLSGNHNHV